jgi:hypothetical protein
VPASVSLSQHATSTNPLTLAPGPAMATGPPPRNSPLCPTPPEFSICIQADIDEVLKVMVVAHVIYQGFAVIKRPRVQPLLEVIIQARAAVVMTTQSQHAAHTPCHSFSILQSHITQRAPLHGPHTRGSLLSLGRSEYACMLLMVVSSSWAPSGQAALCSWLGSRVGC